jgi:lysophospholipase L1-like esterase
MAPVPMRPVNQALAPKFGAQFAASLLAVLLLASGCGQQAKLAPLAPKSVVLAFGDSLTYGTGANEDESYPAQLEKLTGWRVVREGVPGEVSGAGLARLPAMLEAHQPKLLLLCHGGNDFLQRLPKDKAAENLRAMIRLAKTRGVEVLLIGTPEPGLSVTPAAFYAEIAKEFRIPYEGDVLGKILKDSSLKADQVHPNAQGYRLMAERVRDLLRKAGALGS